jgi:hypothetical protein
VPPIVGLDLLDLHSCPSFTNAWMSFRSGRLAAPSIGWLFSRSHFTTNRPCRYTCTCRGA